jgi:hypothetical protein
MLLDASSANAQLPMSIIDRITPADWRVVINGLVFLLAMEGVLPFPATGQDDEKLRTNNRLIAYPSEVPGQVEVETIKKETKSGPNLKSNHEHRSYIHHRGVVDKRVIRDFALFSYSRLSNDIVNGSGLYIETLFSLLEVEEKDRIDVRQDLVRILFKNQRIPAFAAEIAEYGQRK